MTLSVISCWVPVGPLRRRAAAGFGELVIVPLRALKAAAAAVGVAAACGARMHLLPQQVEAAAAAAVRMAMHSGAQARRALDQAPLLAALSAATAVLAAAALLATMAVVAAAQQPRFLGRGAQGRRIFKEQGEQRQHLPLALRLQGRRRYCRRYCRRSWCRRRRLSVRSRFHLPAAPVWGKGITVLLLPARSLLFPLLRALLTRLPTAVPPAAAALAGAAAAPAPGLQARMPATASLSSSRPHATATTAPPTIALLV